MSYMELAKKKEATYVGVQKRLCACVYVCLCVHALEVYEKEELGTALQSLKSQRGHYHFIIRGTEPGPGGGNNGETEFNSDSGNFIIHLELLQM